MYTVGNVADDDTNTYIYYTFIILHYTVRIVRMCLQCFDAVGWAAGRASGL